MVLPLKKQFTRNIKSGIQIEDFSDDENWELWSIITPQD